MKLDNIFAWLITTEQNLNPHMSVSNYYFDKVIYKGYDYKLFSKTALVYSILLLYRLSRADELYRTDQELYDSDSCYMNVPEKEKYPILKMTGENFKEIWTVCLIIASKYVDDSNYDNVSYSSLTKSSLSSINKLEIKILNTLRYNLYFKPEELTELYTRIKEEINHIY